MHQFEIHCALFLLRQERVLNEGSLNTVAPGGPTLNVTQIQQGLREHCAWLKVNLCCSWLSSEHLSQACLTERASKSKEFAGLFL